MMVMPSNNCKAEVHYWQGAYGGLGHLYAPGGQRGPYPHLPYALDNGAYGAFKNDRPFDWEAFDALITWAEAKDTQPLWIVVPDVVGSADETLAMWCERAAPLRQRTGWNLALACQDGMTPESVASLEVAPDVLFIGGSTPWKWESLAGWCAFHPRVHVGRVNSPMRLAQCLDLGVESVDGTGWFRGDPKQTGGLHDFLKRQAAGGSANG